MADDLKSGDKVEWNTPQGKTRGRAVKKVTRETHVKGPQGRRLTGEP